MRRLFPLLMLPLLLSPAYGATTPACKPSRHQTRQTWQQHFAAANVSHDGHLTKLEAASGYPLLAKHFDEIDTDHKGFVTETEVKAWHITRRAAHRRAHPLSGTQPPHAFNLREQNDHPVLALGTSAGSIEQSSHLFDGRP